MFTDELSRKLLDDARLSYSGYDLMQACCYPMTKNKSDESVMVRLYIYVNGSVADIVEQRWPCGDMPDVGIGMHFLELSTLGYGYDGDKSALIDDARHDGIKESEIKEFDVCLKVELLK